jgi:hypothetical protein
MSTETLSPVEDRPRVNTGAPFAALLRPAEPAHIIRSDRSHRGRPPAGRRVRHESSLRDREATCPSPRSTPTRRAACGASPCPRPMAAPVSRMPRWRK